jgi:hypothetical protein
MTHGPQIHKSGFPAPTAYRPTVTGCCAATGVLPARVLMSPVSEQVYLLVERVDNPNHRFRPAARSASERVILAAEVGAPLEKPSIRVGKSCSRFVRTHLVDSAALWGFGSAPGTGRPLTDDVGPQEVVS